MQRPPLRPKQLRWPQWAAPEQWPTVYFTADKLPASLGGDAVLLKFLVGCHNYFTVALNRYLLGKVHLTFTVDSESRLHGPTQPLLQHLTRRTHEALKQTARLHDDYHLELAKTANAVLAALWQSGAAPLARELALPRFFGAEQ